MDEFDDDFDVAESDETQGADVGISSIERKMDYRRKIEELLEAKRFREDFDF